MKKDIHPKYFSNAKVHCSCGASFEVGSTKEIIEIEVCSHCHPFYTGKEKIIDTAGRVEKFRKRVEKQKKIKELKSKAKDKKTAKKTVKKTTEKKEKIILKK